MTHTCSVNLHILDPCRPSLWDVQAGVGIDAGAYARVLMHNASRIADEQASSNVMSCSDRDECEALAFGGNGSGGLHFLGGGGGSA